MDTNIDLSAYWDQILNAWGEFTHFLNPFTHWILNDGWPAGAFLLFVLACAAMVYFAARGQKKALARSRGGYSVEYFLSEMSSAGYDAEVARIVYQYIQGTYRIGFPILPDDDLYTMLGITDEAIRRAMPALLQATGREPRVGRLMKPLMTVEELVGFIEAAPRAAEHAWELQTA